MAAVLLDASTLIMELLSELLASPRVLTVSDLVRFSHALGLRAEARARWPSRIAWTPVLTSSVRASLSIPRHASTSEFLVALRDSCTRCRECGRKYRSTHPARVCDACARDARSFLAMMSRNDVRNAYPATRNAIGMVRSLTVAKLRQGGGAHLYWRADVERVFA